MVNNSFNYFKSINSFTNHVVDADGLRNYIMNHSIFNPMQTRSDCINAFYISDNEQLCQIPKDVHGITFYETEYWHGNEHGNKNNMNTLDFSSFSFNQLQSITFSSDSFPSPSSRCRRGWTYERKPR